MKNGDIIIYQYRAALYNCVVLYCSKLGGIAGYAVVGIGTLSIHDDIFFCS